MQTKIQIHNQSAQKIQIQYRHHLFKLWKKISNVDKRHICINNDDFLNFQPIKDIQPSLLFCLEENITQKWFAFHADSFYQYIHPLQSDINRYTFPPDKKTNPYTRTPITETQLEKFYIYIKLSLLIHSWTKLPIPNETYILKKIIRLNYNPIPFDKRLKIIVNTLNLVENDGYYYFHYDDSKLRNIDIDWWTELTPNQWIHFYIILLRIWDTKLEPEEREKIASNMPIFPHKIPIKEAPKMSLELCEYLLSNIDLEHNYGHTGCTIILIAISMVHPRAKKTLNYYQDIWI